MVRGWTEKAKFVTKWTNTLACAIPSALMVVSYSIEGNDTNSSNELLNDARHAFSCSFRFNNMAEEWGVLWLHFTWISAGIVVVAMLTWADIIRATISIRTKKELKSQTIELRQSLRRMCCIALVVGSSLTASMVTNIWSSVQLDSWTKSSDLWRQCHLESYRALDWMAYGFHEGEEICKVEDIIRSDVDCGGPCMYSPELAQHGYINSASTCQLAEGVLYLGQPYSSCQCGCDDLVNLNPPPVAIMCVSYLSQSLVACIVGISVGLKKANLDAWKSSRMFRLFSTSKRNGSRGVLKNLPANSGEYVYE